MEEETWKPVPGLEHLQCEASSLGRIRAFSRRKKCVLIKPLHLNTHGYLYFRIGEKSPRVHRSVCAAFHGPCPEGKECCHGDGEKTNNSPNNLRWGTFRENQEDNIRNLVYKLNKESVLEIRELYSGGSISQRKLADLYGVSQRQIGFILRRDSWRTT